MRHLQGLLILIVAALIFPGSLIPVPASDALMAAVSATLFMIGVNSFTGVPYSVDSVEEEHPHETPEPAQL